MRFLVVLISFISFSGFANPFTIYTSNDGMISTKVNCIEQGNDFIWIGTNKGINRVVFEGDKAVKFSPRGTSVPVTALEDDGKVIWVGLKGKGVYMMPKNNYKFIGFRKDVLGDKEITGIKKLEGGLMVYTSTSSYTFKFNSKEYQSKGEKIKFGTWIGFDAGGKKVIKNKEGVLVRYNEPTKSIRNFNQNIKPNNFLKFKNGILLAAESGLVFYDPSKDNIEFGDPKINIARLLLNGEDTTANKLDLNWDEHVFKYDFDFDELGEVEEVVLLYKLVGPEGEVKDSVVAKNGLDLKGLSHGDYSLSVSAKNSKGIKSVNVFNHQFSIANPLKDSIWQYIIIGFIVGVWTVIIILITQRKYKKDIGVLEDALLEKTNKLNQIEKGKYGLVEEDEVNL